MRTPVLIAASAAVVALAGCGSLPSPGAAPPSSAPSSAASAPPCVTKDTLVGSVAKNESVMTKLTCKESSVRHPVSGVWTVRCTADYSNGMVAKGVANVLLKSDQVTWSPTDIISYGSGG